MKGLAITNIVLLGLAWIGLVFNVADGSSNSASAMWSVIFSIPMMAFSILYLALKK